MNKFDKLLDEPNWKDCAAELQAQVDRVKAIVDGEIERDFDGLTALGLAQIIKAAINGDSDE